MVTGDVPQQRSALWIYQVDPYEIHYLKFILEAYEGLATLTTLDPEKGFIQLAVPPGSEDGLEVLLRDLGQELELKRVTTSAIRNPK